MSSVFHGITHAVGSILDGVKKVFKAITSSTFGRALLIGATIYLGGAAFGMWQSPFASVNGAFTSEAAASSGTVGATEQAAATTSQMGQAAQSAVADSAASGATAGASGTAADSTAAALNSSAAAGAAPAEASPWTTGATEGLSTSPGGMSVVTGGENLVDPAVAGSGTASSGGLINTIMKNPLAQYGMIQAGAGALQGAFTPNALDIAQKNAELQRQNFAWQQEFLSPNFQVGSLNLGVSPSGQPATDSNGNPIYPAASGTMPPRGLVNQAMTPKQPLPQTIPVRT